MYFIYMLRCGDNSIYTGITPDLKSRMEEHFSGGPKSSKYVRSRGAKKLEAYWETEEKSDALKLEYRIKKNLTKAQKEEIINDADLLGVYLGKFLDRKKYRKGKGFPE